MKKKIVSKAPGKIILTGEHSVVYGKPALVGTVDKYFHTTIHSRTDGMVCIASGLIDLDQTTTINELVDFWKMARRAWNSHLQGNSVQWKSVMADSRSLIKICIGMMYELFVLKTGISVHVDSQVLVGSGMGSSAGLITSVIGGIASIFEMKLTQQELYKLVYTVEQIAHGKASGVDPTAVVYGGVISFTKHSETKKTFEHLHTPSISGSLLLVDTGLPVESTGDMVALVSKRLEHGDMRIATNNLIEQIGRITQRVIEQVKRNRLTFEWIAKNESLLEDLGVVGERAKKIISQLEKEKIVAKVCGAGGVRDGSGIVLAHHDDLDRLKYVVGALGLPYYSVDLGVGGWHIV